jgi:DNA polymerase/3'-5' exonuclease PolX
VKLATATIVAECLRQEFEPFCERIEVAGSIRRQRPEVKDIEIVCVPSWGTNPANLLPDHKNDLNVLWHYATSVLQTRVEWIKPGVSELIRWTIKPDGKYWRGWLPEEKIKLDLFLATPENFGLILAIRTGPAKFSEALVTHAKYNTRYRVVDGYLRNDAVARPIFDERELFDVLGLEYVEPHERLSKADVRRKAVAA